MATQLENLEKRDKAVCDLAFSMAVTAVGKTLGIRDSGFVGPFILSRIGLSVLADQEITLAKAPNLREAAKVAYRGYNKGFLRKNNITASGFKKRFSELIGKGDCSRGEIGKGIKQLQVNGDTSGSEVISMAFADLMACTLKLRPDFVPETGIWTKGSLIGLTCTQLGVDLQRPTEVMIEYGPGVVGSHRISGEIDQLKHSVLIEKNPYTAKVLAGLALLHGVEDRKLTVINDDISSASEGLLNTDLRGQTDLIVASMIYSAGSEEIITGIQSGKRLLREDGTFVIVTPERVEPGQMAGQEMLEAARGVFGYEDILCSYSYMTLGGQKVDAYMAVFKNDA